MYTNYIYKRPITTWGEMWLLYSRGLCCLERSKTQGFKATKYLLLVVQRPPQVPASFQDSCPLCGGVGLHRYCNHTAMINETGKQSPLEGLPAAT